MALPIKPLRRATVDIGGTAVEVRGLSRSEAMKMTTFEDADLAEIYLIARGTGEPEKDVKEFRDSNDVETVGLIVDKIVELSALTKDESDPK